MPFEDAAFDAATLIHVGMNIKDKATLFAEAHRVLKKGGTFIVYDVMRMADAALPCPMPWAQSIETSFVETPEAYRTLLREAGFTTGAETNRREFCLKLAQEKREKAEKEGPPILGLQVLMGPAAKERLGNVFAALGAGTIAPVEIDCRA